MIRSQDFRKDESILQIRLEFLGNEKVVDAPPNIPGAGAAEHVPPRIMASLLLEHAERIDGSFGGPSVHPGALDREKSGDLRILLGACEIYLAVGGIHVAANDELFTLLPKL